MEFYLSFDEFMGKTASPIMLIFLPIFLITTLVEGLLIWHRQKVYPWKNAGVSIGMAIGHFITQAATHGLIFGVIAAAVYEFRLTTIPISFTHWLSLIVLFLLVDLGFYVEHRCSHRSGFCGHRTACITAAKRCWSPPPIGCPGRPSYRASSCSICRSSGSATIQSGSTGWFPPVLSYQFFVHTELVPRIGWLEWFVNTPSAHRVHHASNAEYIDKNYGGVLLIWDHLFGSYQPEQPEIPIRYGLAHPRSAPNNPLVIAYEELWLTLKATLHAASIRQRLALLLGPP